MHVFLSLWFCVLLGCVSGLHPWWKQGGGYHHKDWSSYYPHGDYNHHNPHSDDHHRDDHHRDDHHGGDHHGEVHDEGRTNSGYRMRDMGGVPGRYNRGNGSRRKDLGCACLLYVEQTEVFRRVEAEGRYSCGWRGLERCTSYCANMFGDEGLRARSRQDACDVLGRQVDTTWYRKDRVCGLDGPYRDIRLNENLCCRGGRSTVNCTNTPI